MKKKALVLAICMAFSTPAISIAKGVPNDIIGLNLGDIQTTSTLGQPFRGVIPILFGSVDEANKLKVNLAPKSIFKKVGAEKLPFIDKLSFKVGVQNNKPVIFVHSSQPVNIPFISFILEMVSPHGAIYQDYTVLVDPPGYQVANIERSPELVDKDFRMNKTSASSTHKGMAYEVLEGETLLQIAVALKTSQVSLKKMIDVIHQVNPNAFVDNDMHKLKSGVYLKIPSANKVKNFVFNSTDNNTVNKIPIKVKTSSISSDNVVSSNNESYTVKKGDTLSAITQKFKYGEMSFTKRMYAIFNANPHAFSNNKINILKLGATLSIPYFENSQELGSEQEFIVKELKDSDKKVEQDTFQAVSTSVDSTTKKIQSGNTKIENAITINNLQKRIRVLRNNLSDSKAKLSYLEEVLLSKNVELRKKGREITSLQTLVEEEYSSTKNDLLEDEMADEVEENLGNTTTADFTPEIATLIKERAKSKPSSILSLLRSQENENENDITYILKSLSFSDASYGFLALLLGLGLIIYRKELHAYTVASGDYPKFYPSEADPIELNITGVNDVKTGALNSTSFDNKSQDLNTKQFETEFNAATLDECEQLIEELSNDLHRDKISALVESDKEWTAVEKICDDYLESQKDNIIDEICIDNSDSEFSFEEMVIGLIDELEDKSEFDETNPLSKTIKDLYA